MTKNSDIDTACYEREKLRQYIRDYVHKDEIKKIIRWCKRDQRKPSSLHPDYWQEVIDKLQELLKETKTK